MRPSIVLVLLLFFCSVCLSSFSIVGYLPEWRFGGFDFDRGCALHTHLILFSAEPSGFGEIWGTDRLPNEEVMKAARSAASKHGCKLMLCFGGNGRSKGFPSMSMHARRRAPFVAAVKALLDQYGFDGVDYNWEYPGFAFGAGYKADALVRAEFGGLRDLVLDTRTALGADRPISIAYYPDGRQERMIKELGIDLHVDMMHAMAYDQGGEHHSSFEWTSLAIEQSMKEFGFRSAKVTLGLPFYGRKRGSHEWVTYEDLIQKNQNLLDDDDYSGDFGFNGIKTIERKTRLALEAGLGGVMIWESGQDCRVNPVTRGGTTHGTTCPKGEESSLLRAIFRTVAAWNSNRQKDEL